MQHVGAWHKRKTGQYVMLTLACAIAHTLLGCNSDIGFGLIGLKFNTTCGLFANMTWHC